MARILVVDDEEGIRLTLTIFLSNVGHQVETAEDVPVALERLKARDFDVVVSDIVMPRATGVDLLQAIRQESHRVQVIMMTGQPTIETAAATVRAGAFDYLTKPVSKDAILRCVANAAKFKATEDERVRQAEDLKRQHKQLQDSYDRLCKLEELRDNLVLMIIHDLRSPAALIKGYLDLIRRQAIGKFNQEELDFVDVADRSTTKLLDMITSVVDVSRLEAGEMPLNRQACDMAAVTREVVDSFGSQVDNRCLSVESEPEPALACGDREIISRIIANLLGNALKFTRKDGTIRVRISREDSLIRTAVTDNGPGISVEHHVKIFEKFGQVDKQSRKHSSGLGLAFCKLAVEAHGGKIGVESEVGEGSTFWFALPAS